MAVIGVPLILGILSPFVGAVVVRVFPEPAWDPVMLVFAQGWAHMITYLVGRLALGLPWAACLIAAVFIAITSYARRAPEPMCGKDGYGLLENYRYADEAVEGDPQFAPQSGLQESDRDRGYQAVPRMREVVPRAASCRST